MKVNKKNLHKEKNGILNDIMAHNRIPIEYQRRPQMSTNFYSIRELRTQSRKIWSELACENEIILTNNGKPAAMMINIPEGKFDEVTKAVRQAKAMLALSEMRQEALQEGAMNDEEINMMIKEIRKELKDETE